MKEECRWQLAVDADPGDVESAGRKIVEGDGEAFLIVCGEVTNDRSAWIFDSQSFRLAILWDRLSLV